MSKKILIPLTLVVIVAAGIVMYVVTSLGDTNTNTQSVATLQNQITKLQEDNKTLADGTSSLEKDLKNVKRNRDCVPYDKEIWEVEKDDWYYVPSEMIQLLDDQWENVTFCREDNKYVIQVRKEYTEDTQPDAELLEATRQYFPIAGKELNPANTLMEYQYYLFSAESISLELYGQTKTLPGNELIPLASFVWESALSFCGEDLSLFDGTLDIFCGSGDNMCMEFERSRINLLTGSVSSRGRCASDCDLAAGQTHTYRCGEDITLPWND